MSYQSGKRKAMETSIVTPYEFYQQKVPPKLTKIAVPSS